MSSLHKVLSEYSVPLQIWLAPEARNKVAEAIVPTMEKTAQIETHPIPQIEQLQGPAVLVISAKELTGPDREALRRLAQKAHPGRSVLVGGTSDRDTLMDAINNWGVIRVVPSNAESDTIVEAIRAAGTYLNREVAMETAIDDLDIETTMIDSAIDHLQDSREQLRHTDRSNTATAFSMGMLDVIEREQSRLQTLPSTLDAPQNGVIQQAINGLTALTRIMEMVHDYAIEQSAGIPITPTALDSFVEQIRAITLQKPATPMGSGALVSINPFALFQMIMSFCRDPSLGGVNQIDTHKSGDQAMITLSFQQPLPDGFLGNWIEKESLSWDAIQQHGGHIRAENDANQDAIIELILPTQDAHDG